jgi:hypothetical protein
VNDFSVRFTLPVLSDALDEFINVFKIARDDLDQAVAGIVPDEYFEAELDDDDKSVPGALVYSADEDIRRAFEDFDWALARAIRTLRQLLATAGCDG